MASCRRGKGFASSASAAFEGRSGEQGSPIGLLPISWSSDNGSHLVVHSVDEGSGGSSSIGTYLSQVAENSAGVRYPRELCGRSVLYSPFQSAPNARACGSLSNSSRSRNSSRTLLWNDSA